MKIEDYFFGLISLVPIRDFATLGLILFSGILFIVCYRNISHKIRWVSILFIVEYLYLLFGVTIFFRGNIGLSRYWYLDSYTFAKNNLITPEGGMNVMMFVPLGLLVGIIFYRIVFWKVFILGLITSFIIEILQFLFEKGYFDLDDIIHNTMGSLIGYGLCRIINLFCVKDKNEIPQSNN